MSRAKAYAPDLDFERVEKYVRQAPTLLLPTGWSQWPKGLPPPEHKLKSIDEELKRLSSKRQRILSADQVRVRHPEVYWPSHEVAIRLQLTWYTLVEFQDAIAYAGKEAPIAKRRRDLLGHAEKSLAEYFRLSPADMEMLFAFRKAKAGALADLRALRPPKGGKPAQAWKVWFVVRLGGFWHIITGEQPPASPDGDFAELVYSAWNSLHPDIPEITWDSFVEKYASRASLEEAVESAFITSAYAHRIWRS